MTKFCLTAVVFSAVLLTLGVAHAQTASSAQGTAPQTQVVTPTDYKDLPSYQYDPRLDPAKAPYKTPIAHDVSPSFIPMTTLSGFEIGAKIADYHYDADSNESGATLGLLATYTKAFKSGWFISGDVHADYGFFSSSSGDVLFDGRFLAGHDFVATEWSNGNYNIAPYAGLGYRYVFGDVESFLYIPIGITQYLRLTSESRLAFNTEFDYGLKGGDTYGFRASPSFEWASWSVGPYIEYWNLDSVSSETVEVGVLGRYRF